MSAAITPSIGPFGAHHFGETPLLVMTSRPDTAYAYAFTASDGSVTVCLSMGDMSTSFTPEDAVAIGEMLATAGREAITERGKRATVFCRECSEEHSRTEPTCPIVNGVDEDYEAVRAALAGPNATQAVVA